jgi:hypothetical protein
MQYQFEVILLGEGDNPQEGWMDAAEAFQLDPGIPNYTYPAWFYNPSEGQIVIVENPHSIPKDPDSEEEFPDLTLESMRESDNWFEYDSIEELNRGGM